MTKKEYGWEDGNLPQLGPHSLAKHRILREYVERYLHVLTARVGTESFRVTLVDGFAGGGEYADAADRTIRRPGSPLILLDAVRTAEVAINQGRTKPVRIDAEHVFIEKRPEVAQCLRAVLTLRGDEPRDKGPIFLIEGEFEEQVEAIIARVKSRGTAHRAIFVLDQYGYTAVRVATLKRIIDELPNAEIFLTLAVGWITAYLPNARDAAAKLGLSNETLLRLAEFTDEVDVNDDKRRPDLLAVQRLLHHAFTSDVGTRYYTPFFIVSRESNRPYWFLHMANSSRAHDVVKELHWAIQNHFMHFGRPGLSMLGYDPSGDPEVTRQQVFGFDDGARRDARNALLTEIPRRLAAFDSGTQFSALFDATCNETPATRALMAEVVRDLTVAGELEKKGAKGQRRAAATLPNADDIVRVARQTRMFKPPGV